MDLLYRLFYTAFSMGIIISVMIPVILLLRLLLSKAPRKYIVFLWLLYFFKGICPVSLSSPLCLSSKLNREFHMVMAQLGLEIKDNSGIMKGWRNVFINDIQADRSYIACAIIWVAGIAVILLFTLVRQASNKTWLKNSSHIYGRIYQSGVVDSPVVSGILFMKMYLPAEMRVNDIKYLLQHFEAHNKNKDGIIRFFAFIVLTVQWFNPLMWLAYYLLNIDIEIAADETVAKNGGVNSANGLAQELLNIKEGSYKGRQTLLFFNEKYTQKRAYHLIYMPGSHRQYTKLAFIVLLLCFIWAFLLRPLQILWDGGTWGNGTTQEKDSKLFNEREEIVAASINTVSPSGLDRNIQLVMTSGNYEKGKGYTGSFILKLNDLFNAELGQADINYTFKNVPEGRLFFEEGAELYVYDYNADGTNELVIGQKIDVTGSKFKEITGKRKRKNSVLKEYYIWNIGEMSLDKVSDTIYDTSSKEAASCKFNIPADTTKVIRVKHSKKNIYYVWNTEEEKYQQQELSKSSLKKYKTGYTGVESTEGEKNTHNLQSGNTTYVEIQTQKDATGNEIIKQIILNPGTSPRKMPLKEGYFCDIQWVTQNDKRYAVLIYNGLWARTFTIYDLDRQTEYYAHEDGNGVITSIFKNYNNTGVEFYEDSPVIYRLMGKEDNHLKIGFAINAKDNTSINGEYVYNTVSESITGFNYSQSSNQ
ncbi:MAG: M56 family metallopeptidase [Lachnospiraceae bacterium]|nr:M56 family metallopeptidase [Lachnospiraceae bacterium]